MTTCCLRWCLSIFSEFILPVRWKSKWGVRGLFVLWGNKIGCLAIYPNYDCLKKHGSIPFPFLFLQMTAEFLQNFTKFLGFLSLKITESQFPHFEIRKSNSVKSSKNIRDQYNANKALIYCIAKTGQVFPEYPSGCTQYVGNYQTDFLANLLSKWKIWFVINLNNNNEQRRHDDATA